MLNDLKYLNAWNRSGEKQIVETVAEMDVWCVSEDLKGEET